MATDTASTIIDFILHNPYCTNEDIQFHLYGVVDERCYNRIAVHLSRVRKALQGTEQVLQGTMVEFEDGKRCKQYQINNQWVESRQLDGAFGKQSLVEIMSDLETRLANAGQHANAAKCFGQLDARSAQAINTMVSLFGKSVAQMVTVQDLLVNA